ncbi:unnamed protein product [Phytomonas sp. EM1]|nr:unnamed protein product [Phytomonas sp. EM1]|eukprot:CCW64491.1 unnamed protein product [Phytomonas sp. isolate EM1]
MYKSQENVSNFGTSLNKTSLRERLRARHDNALKNFRESMKSLHEGVDCAQKKVALRLKQELDSSHAATAAILAAEQHTVQEHGELLNEHARRWENVSDGSVLSPFEDSFFSAGDTNFDAGMERMRAERYRLLGQAVNLQNEFSARTVLIQGCIKEMVEHETHRKDAVQSALRELMLSLAKISYCNVTASHVLAQREMHCINQTIAANYEGIQTLFAQLSCRELLKQEQYTTTMAGIYQQVLNCMAKSSAYWLRTLLQSEYFRRPVERVECVQRVSELTTTAHANGVQFLSNLRVMIDSLRDAERPLAEAKEEDYQVCGGSTPTGWLRHYRGETSSGLVPIHSCAEVVDEWRMKASVVVRNNNSRCMELSDRIRCMENARVGVAEQLNHQLMYSIEWIHTPMDDEIDLLRLASVPKVIPEDLKRDIDTSFVKDEYKPFASTRFSQASELQTAYRRLLEPLIVFVRTESLWFTAVVTNRLHKKQHTFEQLLLRASTSVLQWFEKASDALVGTIKGVVGYLREFYQKCYETRMWYNEELVKMEQQLTVLQDRLAKSESKEEAEKLFSQGLNCLEQIAQRHIRFHNEMILHLDQAVDSVGGNTDRYCGMMLDKICVESVEDTEARVLREHQSKVESIMAMLALQEQQQKGKRGNRKGAEEIANYLTLEPMTEDAVPMDVVTYPQLTAQSGVVYNIIAPMQLIREQDHEDSIPFNFPLMSEPTAVPTEFVSCYDALFAGSAESSVDSFISKENDITVWKEALRQGLLDWTLALRAYTMQNIKAFCQRARADQSIETSELLRCHRRRPATLQVQVYESRVRQLEDNAHVAIKYGVRLRERVASVLCVFEEFDKNEVWAAEDKQVLAQLQEMEAQALKAPNASALQSRERQYKAVCMQYVNCVDHRTEVLLDRVKSTISSLTLELHQLQTSHSPHLNDGGKAAMERIHAVLKELDETKDNVCRHGEMQRERRLNTIQTLQARYDATHARTTAELQLIACLQEVASRFRVQVQSFINASKASEDALNRAIDFLDTSRQRMPLRPDFVANILASTHLDVLIAAEVGTSDRHKNEGNAESPLPTTEVLTTQFEHDLQALKLKTQQTVRTCTANEVLSTLDQLRDRLYVRGIVLQALHYSIEMLMVDPEHYIAPRIPRSGGSDGQSGYNISSGASERPSSGHVGGARRGGKGAKSQGAAHFSAPVPEQQLLPASTSALAQLGTWAMGFRTAAMEVARAHFAAYPMPLEHPLPHMLAEAITAGLKERIMGVGPEPGSLDEVEMAINFLCRTQEAQVREHLREALRIYRQQLQLAYNIVQALPQWLSASVYFISATAVSLHVQSVLQRFEAFHRLSTALRIANDRKMKVSLSSQSKRDVLQRLIASESARQALAAEVTARFWVFALHGLQEEAREHAARCHTSSNSLMSLLRGLVGPAHLVALGEGEVVEGHHRGLRYLKQLKSKNTQAMLQNELPSSSVAFNRDTRLQDASGPGKQEFTSSRRVISVGNKERGHNSNLDNTYGGSKTLTPITYPMVELLGLPTAQVRPLEAFYAEHPEWAVALPMSGPAFSHPAPVEDVGAAPAGGGGSRTTGAVKKVIQPEQVATAPPSIPRTSAFIVPDTRLFQETVTLAHKSVEEFNTAVQEIVQHLNKAFHGWLQREAHYKQNWDLSVKSLYHVSARKCSLGSTNGLSLLENDNPE